MRTHGWDGRPPADDDEARERILTAVRDRLATHGSTSTADIATVVGVTRQTIYRYFATTDALLTSAGLHAAHELEALIAEHLRDYLATTDDGDAADALIEVLVFVLEHFRSDPALNRLIEPGRITETVTAFTAPSSLDIGRTILDTARFDWATIGFGDDAQRELIEYLMRMLQTLVVDPGTPPRSVDELREFLRRWVAPGLRAHAIPPGARGRDDLSS